MARIINAVVWLYLWLSQILAPVTRGDYWTEKAHQMVEFGPFDDLARLAGRAVLPLILWALIDWWLRARAKPSCPRTGA